MWFGAIAILGLQTNGCHDQAAYAGIPSVPFQSADKAARIPVHHDIDRHDGALPGQQRRVGILAALGKPSQAEERRHVVVAVAGWVEGGLGIVVVA